MPPDQNTTPAESENIQADKQNPSPENTAHSEPSDALPEAPNAPADGFSAESNNSAINKGDTETSQPENDPQTPENQDSSSGEAKADKENEPVSEPFADTEAKADKETAQIPVNEPLENKSKPSLARRLLISARNAIQFRKRKKLDKIMSLFLQKSSPSAQGYSGTRKITNDEVEKFLHVSDATATRYLSQLEKEGKIKQNGKTGHMVSYSPK